MLTKSETKILSAMNNGAELVESIPGGWWLEDNRVSGRVCWSLLRKVLISQEQYSSENFRRYRINSDGVHLLTKRALDGGWTCAFCGLHNHESVLNRCCWCKTRRQ